jgi:hypothetical protein
MSWSELSMDKYSYAELTEFFFLAQSAMDTQFQYWITVTFAAVVAGFIAGERLTRLVRILAATLYILASVVLFMRFIGSALTMVGIQEFLMEEDAFALAQFGLRLAPLRISLFLVGTAAALFFLLCPQRTSSKKDGAGRSGIDRIGRSRFS